jgi:hypothetical protein
MNAASRLGAGAAALASSFLPSAPAAACLDSLAGSPAPTFTTKQREPPLLKKP